MITVILFILALVGIWADWSWKLWLTFLLIAMAVEHISS